MKKYKIINQTRFYTFVVIVVSVCFAMLSFFKSFSRAEDLSTNLRYKEIYVQPGDTVWRIASVYKQDKSDLRDVVAEIRDFNNLDDLIIKPGDVIQIPIREK